MLDIPPYTYPVGTLSVGKQMEHHEEQKYMIPGTQTSPDWSWTVAECGERSASFIRCGWGKDKQRLTICEQKIISTHTHHEILRLHKAFKWNTISVYKYQRKSLLQLYRGKHPLISIKYYPCCQWVKTAGVRISELNSYSQILADTLFGVRAW